MKKKTLYSTLNYPCNQATCIWHVKWNTDWSTKWVWFFELAGFDDCEANV